MQHEQRDFRRAIQADGDGNGSQACVGIEAHFTYAVTPQNVFPGHFRQVQSRKQGKSYLVRVSGELQIDRKPAGYVGEVRFVREQDHRFAWGNATQSFTEIGGSADHIVDAGEPEAPAITLDGDGLIGQRADALGLEGAGYVQGVGFEVVIAENGPQTLRCSHLVKQASARFGIERCLGVASNQRRRNEVSGENDEVGMQGVHHRNGSM